MADSQANSTPQNAKLQVIDLTGETFDFSAGEFAIEGFTDKNGKQWFSAEIVCGNLDLGNVSQAVSRLPYEDKAIIISSDNGNAVRHLMVTEPGLYRLIFRSRKKEAIDYQNWVFNDVLPAIRKEGGYISPSATAEQVEQLKARLNETESRLATAQARMKRLQQELYLADTDESSPKRYRQMYDNR